MTTLKWSEERTAELVNTVADESPVTRATVSQIAEQLEVSTRSISSKLRKLGYDVELAVGTPKVFSDEATAQLREFVTQRSREFTYVELAGHFPGGYTPKAIQGKILSMELTSHVKEAPKAETVKSYTDAEQVTVLNMIAEGRFVEEIADAVGKTVQSVRGKALSLQRSGQIESMPKQRDVKGNAVDPLDAISDLDAMTVAQIAEAIGKTERGVKTMLTRRGLIASDYDGAAKREKAAA